MLAKIQIRRDNTSNWSNINPTLLLGEIGYELDTNKFKIGDGVNSWNTLPYQLGQWISDSYGNISYGENPNENDVILRNNLKVGGDLSVKGTTTFVNTKELVINDKVLTLNWNLDDPGYYDGQLVSGIEVNAGANWNYNLDDADTLNDYKTFFANGIIETFTYDSVNKETVLSLGSLTSRKMSGTVTLNSGSKNVVGTGTSFLSQVTLGSKVLIDGQLYVVGNVFSDTSLSLTSNSTTNSSDVDIFTDYLGLSNSWPQNYLNNKVIFLGNETKNLAFVVKRYDKDSDNDPPNPKIILEGDINKIDYEIYTEIDGVIFADDHVRSENFTYKNDTSQDETEIILEREIGNWPQDYNYQDEVGQTRKFIKLNKVDFLIKRYEALQNGSYQLVLHGDATTILPSSNFQIHKNKKQFYWTNDILNKGWHLDDDLIVDGVVDSKNSWRVTSDFKDLYRSGGSVGIGTSTGPTLNYVFDVKDITTQTFTLSVERGYTYDDSDVQQFQDFVGGEFSVGDEVTQIINFEEIVGTVVSWDFQAGQNGVLKLQSQYSFEVGNIKNAGGSEFVVTEITEVVNTGDTQVLLRSDNNVYLKLFSDETPSNEDTASSINLQFYDRSLDLNGLKSTIQWDEATKTFRINYGVSSNKHLILDEDGKVGIGTDTPISLLELAEPTSGSTLKVNLQDNELSPFEVVQGSDNYIKVVTTDGEEKIVLGNKNTDPDIVFDTDGLIDMPTTLAVDALKVGQLEGDKWLERLFKHFGIAAKTSNYGVALGIEQITDDSDGDAETEMWGMGVNSTSDLGFFKNSDFDYNTLPDAPGFTLPTPSIIFKSDGKVGIGTTTPTQPLQVAGNIKGDGTLEIDGSTTLSSTLGVTGASTLSSTLDVAGDLKVNTDKVVITASSGNTDIAGTLGVTGASTLSSTLDVSGDVKINTDKFVVTATSGNTDIAGTLDVTGAATLGSTLGVTGASTLSSTLDVAGDLKVNTNKVVITAASGNTDIAGTLDVTGATTLDSTLQVLNNTDLDGTLDVLGDLKVNTDKFIITASSGNTDIAGTLDVTGATTLDSTLNVAGNADLDGTLDVLSDLKVNTDKFVVTAASGNTDIEGTLNVSGDTVLSSNLDVTGTTTLASLDIGENLDLEGTLDVKGDLKVNTDKFVVTAASGNTDIAGTLDVTGATTLDSTLQVLNNTDLDGTLDVLGDLKVNTDKVVITAASGNTDIAGTLDVTGASTLSSTLDVTGLTTLSDKLGVGVALPSDKVDIDGALRVSNSWSGINTQSGILDYNANTTRIITHGDGTDRGGFQVISQKGDGSESITPLSIDKDGNVDFSGSINANNGVVFGGSTSTESGAVRYNGSAWEGYNGSSWTEFAQVASIGGTHMTETTPTSPLVGDFWWDTSDGTLRVYYADGDSNQWVTVSTSANLTADSDIWLKEVNNDINYPDGNVGIGTTSPSQLLQVGGDKRGQIYIKGTDSASPTLTLDHTSYTNGRKWALYSGGARAANFDILDLSTTPNATPRFSIDENGKVGIGTTSPNKKLHVTDSNEIVATLTNSTNASATKTLLRFSQNNDNDLLAGTIGINRLGANAGCGFEVNLSDSTGAEQNRLTILEGGNVGIGTNNPVANLEVNDPNSLGVTLGDSRRIARFEGQRHKLDLKTVRTKTLASEDWKDTTYKLLMIVDNTEHQSIDFVSDSDMREHVDIRTGNQLFHSRFYSDGNLGIGTSSPDTYNLGGSGRYVDIKASSSHAVLTLVDSNNAGSYLQFGNPTIRRGSLHFFDGSHFAISTNGTNSGTSLTERFRITNNGNVGIGTTSPNHKLEVASNGSGLYSGYFVNTHDNGSGVLIDAGTLSSNFALRVRNKTSNDLLAVTATGNVGIGTTSPTEKLDVNGAIRLASTANNNAGTIKYTSNDFFGYNGTEWLSLTSGGGSSSYISDTAPTSPSSGDFWWDSDDGELRIYYTDGDGTSQWVTVSGGSSSSESSSSGSSPWGTSGSDIYYSTGKVGIGTTPFSFTSSNAGHTTPGLHIANTTSMTSNKVVDSFSTVLIEDSESRLQLIGANSGSYATSITLSSVDPNLNNAGNRVQSNWSLIHRTTENGDANKFQIAHQDVESNINHGDVSGFSAVKHLTIDTSGNVGIGNTCQSPVSKLEVGGNLQLDANNASLYLKSGASGTTGKVYWTYNSDTTIYGSLGLDYDTRATLGMHLDSEYPITLDCAGGTYIDFSVDGTNKMRMDSDGSLNFNTGNTNKITFNDNSSYWLSTGPAENWGIYWNTVDNKIEFHGNGSNKLDIDLDSGALSSLTTISTNNDTRWYVSSSDRAYTRADARDDGIESRLHWYGVNTSGNSRKYRQAWYDGSAYVNIDTDDGAVNLTYAGSGDANLKVEGYTVWHGGNHDYEEGTFTPILHAGVYTGTWNDNGSTGIYTKIGNLVTISLYLTSSTNISFADKTKYIVFKGLPFSTAVNGSTTGSVANGAIATHGLTGTALLGDSSTQIYLYGFNSNASISNVKLTMTYRVS